jgi:hypothetical protein
MAEQLARSGKSVLIVGSSPDALRYKSWPKTLFDSIVVINNAWKIRQDWDFHIYPEDFPMQRRSMNLKKNQNIISYKKYVPAQNAFGGFVYAGATMAFTAAYWALSELQPSVLAFIGCDMVYPDSQPTHFYGTGDADPLRKDITLQNLEAKSTRLQILAAQHQCLCINLTSLDESRLVFPKVSMGKLQSNSRLQQLQNLYQQLLNDIDSDRVNQARHLEDELAYFVESGEYWNHLDNFSWQKLKVLDKLWFSALSSNVPIAKTSRYLSQQTTA